MNLSFRTTVTTTDVAQGQRSATLADFRAHAPSGLYIYMPCREGWTARAVDIVVGPQQVLENSGKPKRNKKGELVTEPASVWLLKNQRVEQMAWVPGERALIRDRLVVDGGWIERPEVTCLNMYRPPGLEPGDAQKAGPWLEHAQKVFSGDADHIVRWLAQRRQRPATKINHALVLGSEDFGIGKDMLLVPIKEAVGPWNFHEVAPIDMLGTFNPFVKSVILRINEARDLGEVNRFAFYDRLKAYTASPPEVLQVNEKHLRQYYAFNCMGVIITTNHKTDGIYLPAGDRRHFVAWSERVKADFGDEYWNNLTAWYEDGGCSHVTAYLDALDISDFNPKAPPPKTAAFWEIVVAGESPEDAELADAIDRLGARGIRVRSSPTPKATSAGRTYSRCWTWSARKATKRLNTCWNTSTDAQSLTGLTDAVTEPTAIREPRVGYGASTTFGKPCTLKPRFLRKIVERRLPNISGLRLVRYRREWPAGRRYRQKTKRLGGGGSDGSGLTQDIWGNVRILDARALFGNDKENQLFIA